MLHFRTSSKTGGQWALALILYLPFSSFAQQSAAQDRPFGLNPILVSFLIGIASGVAVLYMSGWRPGRRTLEERGSPVVVEFHEKLGAQIERVSPPGTSEVDIQARAIVNLRDEYRETLSNLQKLLNSEIDRLSAQLRDLEGLKSSPANQQKVRKDIEQTLEVLRRVWPDKAARIEVELRKLRAEQNQREI